jgi:hypothetical protein
MLNKLKSDRRNKGPLQTQEGSLLYKLKKGRHSVPVCTPALHAGGLSSTLCAVSLESVRTRESEKYQEQLVGRFGREWSSYTMEGGLAASLCSTVVQYRALVKPRPGFDSPPRPVLLFL